MEDSGSDSSQHDTDGTVRRQFDWETTTPSAGAVETIAAAADSEPGSIRPLYEFVDPDALDVLLSPRTATKSDTTTVVSFPFDGLNVTVYSTGEVEVRPSNAKT